MLKASRYNHFFQLEDGNWLGYNLLSKGLVLIESKQFPVVETILTDPNGHYRSSERRQLRDSLAKGRFLIDETIDELKLLHVRYNREKFDPRILHLTILPTYNCNFQCLYCFQQQLSKIGYQIEGEMKEDVIIALIDYVKKATSDTKQLVVDWYGGEPLLALRTVMRLSMAFKEICEENGCSYTSYITTNGYLLSHDVCEQLKRAGIRGIMVTVDGPPNIHNRRRPLKGGGPTFNVILSNLKTAVNFFDPINIRTNIDHESADSLGEFLEILAANDLIRPNIHLVFSDTEIFESIVPELQPINSDSYGKVVAAMKKALRMGFNISRSEKESLFNCLTTKLNTFTITPSGNVYKCPSFAGDPNIRDGYLDIENGDIKLDYSSIEWLAFDPFENPRCRECKMLPICLGGCAYNEIMSRMKRDVPLRPQRRQGDCQQSATKALELALEYDYYKYLNRKH